MSRLAQYGGENVKDRLADGNVINQFVGLASRMSVRRRFRNHFRLTSCRAIAMTDIPGIGAKESNICIAWNTFSTVLLSAMGGRVCVV